jgi:hypothetical protein
MISVSLKTRPIAGALTRAGVPLDAIAVVFRKG